MGVKHPANQAELVLNVINEGLCVKCGACVGLCPYFKFHDGKVVVMDPCASDGGRCVSFCPVFNAASADDAIGKYKEMLSVRAVAKGIRERSQNGGVVTALLAFAIETGIVNRVIATDTGEERSPKGICVESADDIKNLGGARYSASACLSALNELGQHTDETVAVVGLPCQMQALSNRKSYLEQQGTAVSDVLKIGLFCTWSLDYRAFSDYLRNKNVSGRILKYDIPPPPAETFIVYTEKETIEFPLPEIRAFIQKGCTHCEDMTSTFADISVGAFEGRDGWNTVIVRTDRGKEILDRAVEKGVIEAEPFPDENFNGLKQAAKNKQTRGKTNKDGHAGAEK